MTSLSLFALVVMVFTDIRNTGGVIDATCVYSHGEKLLVLIFVLLVIFGGILNISILPVSIWNHTLLSTSPITLMIRAPRLSS